MARNRRRVAIERIEGEAARQVSFSKRRQGLFKKVCELSALCGAESAVLVRSPAGRLYSLGDPDVLTVVDRFLEYAAAPPAPGAERQQEDGARRRQSQPRHAALGASPSRRRVVEEELYRQLAEQEDWMEVAKAYRAALLAETKEKEESLPQRWGAKVEDLGLEESEEMTDMLEELALKVGDLIMEKDEQEGVPPEQRWSPDNPFPPASNPWRHAAYMASFGLAAPAGAAAAAGTLPSAGGASSGAAAPLNPFLLGVPPAPVGPNSLAVGVLPAGGPGLINGASFGGASTFSPFTFGRSSPSSAPPSRSTSVRRRGAGGRKSGAPINTLFQTCSRYGNGGTFVTPPPMKPLMQSWMDGEGSSTALADSPGQTRGDGNGGSTLPFDRLMQTSAEDCGSSTDSESPTMP